MVSRMPPLMAPRTPPKAPLLTPKPPTHPPPRAMLVAASAKAHATALAGRPEAVVVPRRLSSTPSRKHPIGRAPPPLAERRPYPKVPIGARPRVASRREPASAPGAGLSCGTSSGLAVAKSISKRPRLAPDLKMRARSFLKVRFRKKAKSRRSEDLVSGASSSSATARAGQLAAAPIQSDPYRLQMRLTWWGFVNDQEVGAADEERMARNGGIIAFSDLLAPGLPLDWAPEGCCRCEGAGSLQVMVNPFLVPQCFRMRVYSRMFMDAGADTHIELVMGVWRAFRAEGVNFGHDQFDFAVVSVTLKKPQGHEVDAQVPTLGVAEDWFLEAQAQLRQWLMELTPFPRFILGHLGQLAMAFANMLEEVTWEHACWAGAGPTVLAGDIAFGGVWIVGPHMMLTGSAVPEDDHASIEDRGYMQRLPQCRTACTERFGYEVGTPTLFLGRSKRSSQHSRAREKIEHKKYASTEHGRCFF